MKIQTFKPGLLILFGLLLFSLGTQANLPNDLSYIDPKGIVPSRPLNQALAYLKKYPEAFPKDNVLTLVNFSKHSSRRRFYIIDLSSGRVENYLVAHGRNTDNGGWAQYFSNTRTSGKSSVGFYRTRWTYNSGKTGYSLRLDGLSKTNSNALKRGILMHGAWYVQERNNHAGRSGGCFALDQKYSRKIIDRIRGGSLVYAWSGQ